MSLALDAPAPIGFAEKIWRINWGLVLVLTAIAGVGVLALYSAAGGRFEPWAARHAVRYGMAFGLMLVVALIHPKVWLAMAWPIYIVSVLMLVAVDIIGKIGMGAQADWDQTIAILKNYRDLQTDKKWTDFHTNEFVPK